MFQDYGKLHLPAVANCPVTAAVSLARASQPWLTTVSSYFGSISGKNWSAGAIVDVFQSMIRQTWAAVLKSS